MVDIDNYEAYILDYLEGNLAKDMTQSMAVFLENNPSIKDEVSDLLDYSLVGGELLVFEDKGALKKKPRPYSYILLWSVLGVFLLGYMVLSKEDKILKIPDNKIELNTPINKGKDAVESAEDTQISNPIPTKKDELKPGALKDKIKTKKAYRPSSKTQSQKPIIMAVKNDVKGANIREDMPKSIDVVESKEDVLTTTSQYQPSLLEARRSIEMPLKIKTISGGVFATNKSNIDINTLAYASTNTLLNKTQPTIAISIHLGPLARAKNKLDAFWKKDEVLSVREALTPEYFAKN